MASQGNRSEPRRATPRLYLATPRVADPAGLTRALTDALGAADVAAVLLRLADGDDRTLTTHIKTLVPIVQKSNVALLVDGHTELIARAGADGAHLTGIDEFNAALATLKPQRIAGCGGLDSRHDAMLAAEADADYVMFGEPDEDGHRPSFAAILERIEWWAQVFEVPCVAFAASPDEVSPLAAAGADFVMLGDWLFADARGAAGAVTEAAARLAAGEEVAG
jgi:thiamine-phosphate pyrophosphorylase